MKENYQQEQKNQNQFAEGVEIHKGLKIINIQVNQGTYGKVVIVEDKLTKIQYYIKIISILDQHNGICSQKLKNIKKEANFLKQCSHPNVVKYIDEFQINSNYFIQMEKCEKNLEQWFEDKNNDIVLKHQLISFACQTLSAIQYFHSNEFILKNFSLRNIFIERNNHIKICNFGFAQKDESELSFQQFKNSCRKEEMIYYPPELINLMQDQLSNKKGFIQNKAGDIWAFGVCFYILGGGNIMDYQKIHNQGYKNIESLDENINKILSEILSQQPNQRHDIEQIIKYFQILKQEFWNKKQADILFTLFRNLKHKKNMQKALDLILICVDILPDNISYLLELGLIQLNLNFCDEAIKSYQKCLEIIPNDDGCHYNFSEAYKNKVIVKEVFKSYQRCLEINPKYSNCYMSLGDAQMKQGMRDEAIESYQKCLEINPKHSNCYYSLGKAYSENGMVEEAIKSYRKCIEIDNKNESCYKFLGIKYAQRGMVDESMKSLQKCLEIDPKNYQYYLLLGITYKKKGRLDESFRSFQKCYKINPEVSEVYLQEIKKAI